MKKNIIIKLIFLFVLMGIDTNGFGQEKATAAENFSLPREPIIYSPQVAEMIRYDQTSANMNLGRIDLTIPLVDWKDKDFDIPISLSYNSAGFRPRNLDNYVGRDWMLNIGGVVYRHVNGVPDDIKGGLEPLAAQAGQYYYIDGFLSVLNKKYFNLEKMNKEVWTNPYQYTFRKEEWTSQSVLPGIKENVESSADIFYFSFGKHAGKFMINYDGSVSVSGNNGRKYEVDLSGMKMFDSTEAQDTYIRIKTDDGYVYTFGGSGYASLEYTALSWEGNFYRPLVKNKAPRNEITAYHLTEVKAPNGRKLKFAYRDIDNNYHKDPWLLADLNTQNQQDIEKLALQYSLSGKSMCQMYRSAPLDIYLNNDVLKPVQRLYALNKIALIDCITTDMATFKFHYSKRDKHIIYGEDGSNPASFPFTCGVKLDKIEMQVAGYNKLAQLKYVYQLGNRMFLQQVTTTGYGTYSLRYNNYSVASAPTPMTYNIDHWGFWRGRKTNNGIIPAMRLDNLNKIDHVIVSDDRNSTGEDYDYTLLREVTYPTGGKSVFEYEPNQYSRIPIQNMSTSYRIGLGYPSGKQYELAGGARVFSISHCDNTNQVVKRRMFTYGGSLSSGEIMYMPFYKYTGTLRGVDNKYIIDSFSIDSEGITDLPYPSEHIRYPEVTEHFVDSSGDLSQPHFYKTINYTGCFYRDAYYYDGDFIIHTYPLFKPEVFFPNIVYQEMNKNLLAHLTTDISLQYGQIEQESYYNSHRDLVKRVNYMYGYQNRDKYALRVYAPAPHFGLRTALYTHIVKEPFYEQSLTKKETIYYSVPGNSREIKRDTVYYSYDKDGYLKQEISLKSYGDSLVTQYTYERFATNNGFQILPAKKAISICKPGGKLALTKEQLYYKYKSNSSKDSFWTLAADNVSDGKESLISRYEILFTDAYGNPIETVKDGGAHTVYLWAHYGQFLIARIDNATYDEVCEALGGAPESLSEQCYLDSSVLLLREKLLQAQVYTYTYDWGVGIKSETSPSGKTVYYDYDTHGRLIQTWQEDKNGKKEILQLNDYHIINE